MKKLTLLLLVLVTTVVNAQLRNNDVYEETEMNQANVREIIRIPDIDGFYTLKCDFHIHTVFSDGGVWPTARVNEAWNNGLDAIAITDHIEYRPYKDILSGDLNTSYNMAKARGDEIGLIVIRGTEITREKPLGHLNALFITDANPLDVKDPLVALDIAHQQGAFIMWNHPGWPDDKSTKYEVHDKLIDEKKINGIEVFNHLEYYPISFDWCKDLDLAFMGNSDIHETISNTYGNKKNARPLTLVFAKERSDKGIKDALFQGNCVAFFNGQIAGKMELLTSLIRASLDIKVLNQDKNLVEISNDSDIDYRFTLGERLILLPANKVVRTTLPKEGKITVLNCYCGNNQCLEIKLPL